jgi:serine/threonine protein kinase/Tfp pilus assembly protein PilF
MSDRNLREEAIFDGALQLPPEQRTGYIKAACGPNAELQQRVQDLLEAHMRSDGPLSEGRIRAPAPFGVPPSGGKGQSDAVGPPEGGTPSPDAVPEGRGSPDAPLAEPSKPPPRATIVLSAPPSEKPGDRIGHYKILQQIGEGGCGVVYMAEQEEPIRRRVAFKVIKLGMDTKQVIARFEAERQALALMDHPNIAKVLDAGATGTGRPFFVMELVRGIKVTDYCDQNNLSTTDRLNLFIRVAQAIQHAHQKGIIHRDIKPSNILVTLHDGVPVPKVIDFGIAKATDQRLTDKTLFTQFEQFIGTPAYTSPEQAEMSGLDVDTRSDIYSLGVLLYELLTGKTPFDPKELMAAGLDAMRRTIREKEPPRPSTKLSTMLDADLTTVARQRHVEPPKLVHLLKGDLDWIVMKALEKDRTRRYETANGLALDVERYLQNEPVIARPPSRVYRFQKLVRRNKLAFSAAAAVAGALILGLGLSTWMYFREREARRLADTEAKRSQQVALFLEKMLGGVGPSVALGRDTTLLREILDKTVDRVTKDLTDQPDVEAELCNTIGEVYRALGQYGKAEEMHRGARAIQGKAPGKRSDIATSLHDLALVLKDQGKLAEAEALLRQALSIRRKLLGNEHKDVALCMNSLAHVLRSEGKLAEAETLHRQALAMQEKLEGKESLAAAFSLNNLALVLREQGKLAEAETCSRESLRLNKKLLGEQNPGVAISLDNLAFVLCDEGKLEEAETLERQALAMGKRLLGNEHPNVATALNDLALVFAKQGKLTEAESLHREALAMRRKLLGNDQPETAASLNNLCLLLCQEGKLVEAESTEREALAIHTKLSGRDSLPVATSLNNLALVLRDEGKLAEAESSLREALTTARNFLGDGHPSVAISLRLLAGVLKREGKDADLEALAKADWVVANGLLRDARAPVDTKTVVQAK